MWKTKVLVRREHSTGEQVGLAHVIEEAADVAIETGIDTVEILRLGGGGVGEDTCGAQFRKMETSRTEVCQTKKAKRGRFFNGEIWGFPDRRRRLNARITLSSRLKRYASFCLISASASEMISPTYLFEGGFIVRR